MTIQYFAHNEIDLSQGQRSIEALQMMRISQDQAAGCWNALELETDAHGCLIRAKCGHETLTAEILAADPEIYSNASRRYGFSMVGPSHADKALGKLIIPELPPLKATGLKADENGPHHLGGAAPEGFLPAKTGFPNDTQYIGTLMPGDPGMAQIREPLHICVPLFDDFNGVVLDYSDPLKPVPAAPENWKQTYIGSSYGRVSYPEGVVFRQQHFVSTGDVQGDDPRAEVGTCVLPEFVQSPAFLTSPVTGKLLPFLCQIKTGVTKLAEDVVLTCETYEISPYLNFWGDGVLFLFWEPETRQLGILTQNT